LPAAGACYASKLSITDNKINECSHFFLTFRIDPDIVNSKSRGIRKAFFCGSNTSCRQHLRQHYAIYQQCCQEQGLTENHRAVPPQILKEREDAKKPKKQTNLDGIVTKQSRPAEYSRDGILEAVAKLIVCDDQVSEIVIFRKDLAEGVDSRWLSQTKVFLETVSSP
jgi:hypothetical protein